jgi:hypothetical protein
LVETYKARKNGIVINVLKNMEKSSDINPLDVLFRIGERISAGDVGPG